jgi:hypothetical protein
MGSFQSFLRFFGSGFGQPSGGFCFWNDFLTASRQLPEMTNLSGCGPGVFFLRIAFFGIVSRLTLRR